MTQPSMHMYKRALTRVGPLLLVLALPLTGCFEDFATAYDGPTVVEFDQTLSGGYSLTVPEGAGVVSRQINLIGPQQGSPSTITFDVVGDGTTAVDGTHYSLPTGTQFEIPANSSFGQLQVNILDGGLDSAQQVTLQLELVGSADGSIGAAENLDDFTITIVGS